VSLVVSRWFGNQIDKNSIKLHPNWHILIILGCGAILIGIGYAASLPTPSYIVIAFYPAYILCTTAIWSLSCLLSNGYTRAKIAESSAWGICIGICLVLLILAAYFPRQYWTDEGYNTGLALSIGRTGQFAVPLYQLTPQIYGPNYSLVYVVLGAIYQIFGVHLAYGRMLIFVVGLLSLFFVSRACFLYYSTKTTRIVVVAAAFVLLGVNYLRADVEVALWLSLAFWAYALAAHTGRKWWHYVVGLAVGFSLDGHPNSYRFALAFAVAYGIDYLLECRSRRSFVFSHPVFYVLGGLLSGGILYILLYSTLASGSFFSRVQSFQLTLNFSQLITQLGEQLNSAIRNAALFFGLVAVGVVISLRRRYALDRLLVLVLVISALVLALIYGYYRDYYFVHLLPVYVLFGAVALDYFERHLPPSLVNPLMNALLILVLLPSIGWLSAKMMSNRSQDYSQAIQVAEQIRGFVPTQDVFIGADPLYLRMVDYPHFVEFNTGLAMALYDKIDEKTAWKRINPGSVAILRNYPIPPPQSLIDYVNNEHFTLVHCWNADRIGRVDLYMKTVSSSVVPNPTCDELYSARGLFNFLQ
jgi:hypothetical protein